MAQLNDPIPASTKAVGDSGQTADLDQLYTAAKNLQTESNSQDSRLTLLENGSWTNIVLSSGFQLSTLAPAYSKVGKRVFLKGRLQPNPAGNFSAGTALTIAAAGAVPSPANTYRVFAIGTSTAAGFGRLVVNSDGSLVLTIPPSVNASEVDLTGVTYDTA